MLTIININKSGEFSINSLDDISEKKISLDSLVAKILARISFYPDEKIIIKGHISSAHNLATDLILSLNKSHLSSHYYYLTSNTKETSPDGDKILNFNLNRSTESVNWIDSLYYWQDEWALNCFPTDKKELADLKVLSFADLSYMEIGYQVSTIPKEIGNLIKLESLILGNVVHEEIMITKLNELPKEIGNLTKLKHLHAQYNNLKTLPKEIGYLYSLSELKLGANEIFSLPKSIGFLANLKLLTLWGNALETVPAEIGQLTQLEGLDLSMNPLSELPKEIVNLTNLKTLYLPKLKLSILQKKWIEELKEYDCEVDIS
jgi:Leucine-rich repeat (LRR) protein